MAKYVDHLLSIGVRLVALDFDATIVDVHTGGKWKEGAKKLAKHVRPCFADLMDAVLKQKGMYLAIVTQSPQTDLIRKVLKKKLSGNHKEVVIKGEDQTWEREPGIPKGGKQQHLNAVMKELESKCGVTFAPKEVLLVDDDFINTGIALSYDVKTVTFGGEDSIDKILKLTREPRTIGGRSTNDSQIDDL
eukprot:m.137750 g.137750  ORF g.137750 m.137750 type:complete len:190 (+) comp38228_c1_seq1:158-727(+)